MPDIQSEFTSHIRKQENSIENDEIIKTEPEQTQILESADKKLKVITAIFLTFENIDSQKMETWNNIDLLEIKTTIPEI